jgi:hypothetical protein
MDYKENKQSIITQQPDGSGKNLEVRPDNQDHMMPAKGTNSFIRDLRSRIDSYFQIVLRSVKDSIPKAIGYFLVRAS